MKIDDLLNIVGGEGQFQKRLFFTAIMILFLNGLIGFMLPYIYFDPDFYCKSASGDLIKCTEVDACASPHGFEVRVTRTSMVTENELWCDQRVYKSIAISFINFFASIVSLFFISASDSVGRVRILKYALVMLGVGMLGGIWVYNYYLNTMFNTLIWLSSDIFMAVTFVYMYEFTLGAYRNRSNQILYTFYSVGIIVYNGSNAGFGSLWMVYALPLGFSLIVGPLVWVLLETPAVLGRVGDWKGLRDVLGVVWEVNGGESRDEREGLGYYFLIFGKLQ